VLNDIFRYLAEEPEEYEEVQNDSAAPVNGTQEPATAAVEEDASHNQNDEMATSEEVDGKLEEAADEETAVKEVAPAAPVDQVPEEIEAPEEEEVPAAVEEASKEPEAVADEPAAEPEKPKEPAPTPAPSASKAVAMPSGPPKPAAPRTWASLAASANKVATPIVAAPASQQAPAQQQKAAAPTQPAAGAAPSSQTPAPARDESPANSQGEAAGWQSVVGSKKEQSRVQNQAPAADADQRRAYIKNVYSQVDEPALKAALSQFGEIEYMDISRGKVL
jgi:hypothetical protein